MHEVNYLTKPIFEMHEFPEHLAALGHDVGFVQFPEGESDSTVAAIPFRQLVRGRVLQEQRLTLYTPKTASGGLLGRLIAVFSFKAQFIRVLNDFEPDVVVSFSVPTSGWQAVQACKKLGVPLLFRALDVSHKIRRSFFSPLVGLAEKFIYKNADWVSANNPAMLAYVRANGAKFERSKVNFPPLDLIHFDRAREAKTEMRTELGIPQTANVVLYMGSFFYFSGLPEVLRSFAESSEVTDRLVLIGGGEQDDSLRTLAADLDTQNRVIFTGIISYADLPRYLSVADVAINPLVPSLVASTALPNKVLQYMAAGLTVITTRLKGLEMCFGNDLSGLIFVDKSEDLILTALKTARRSSGAAKRNIENTRIVAELFDKRSTVKSFEQTLKILAGAKP